MGNFLFFVFSFWHGIGLDWIGWAIGLVWSGLIMLRMMQQRNGKQRVSVVGLSRGVGGVYIERKEGYLLHLSERCIYVWRYS